MHRPQDRSLNLSLNAEARFLPVVAQFALFEKVTSVEVPS